MCAGLKGYWQRIFLLLNPKELLKLFNNLFHRFANVSSGYWTHIIELGGCGCYKERSYIFMFSWRATRTFVVQILKEQMYIVLYIVLDSRWRLQSGSSIY